MISKHWTSFTERWIPDPLYRKRGLFAACLSCLLALLTFFAIDSFVIVRFNDPFDFLFTIWPLLIIVYCISLVPTLLFALIILYLLHRINIKNHLTLSKAIWIGAILGMLVGFLLCAFFLLIPSAHNTPMIFFIVQEWHMVIFYGERVFAIVSLGTCAGIATSWYAARYLLRDNNL